MPRIWLLLITMIFFPAAAFAAPQESLPRIETYLNGLTTIAADFTQVAPDGSLASGKFYLQRPGKMRWQYDPPTPILMVSNGSTITYFDRELAQTSYIPIESTLAGFLARDTITLSGDVTVKSLVENAGILRLTIFQTGKDDEGSLLLEFSDHPLQLRNFTVTDAAGQVTTIALNNARFGDALDAELFVFRDPSAPKRR
jgi:outer membrane lipoprotein-sorting protein